MISPTSTTHCAITHSSINAPPPMRCNYRCNGQPTATSAVTTMLQPNVSPSLQSSFSKVTASRPMSPECGCGPLPPWKTDSNRCVHLLLDGKIARDQECTPPGKPADPNVNPNVKPSRILESLQGDVSRMWLWPSITLENWLKSLRKPSNVRENSQTGCQTTLSMLNGNPITARTGYTTANHVRAITYHLPTLISMFLQQLPPTLHLTVQVPNQGAQHRFLNLLDNLCLQQKSNSPASRWESWDVVLEPRNRCSGT
jgi:hypothetical protein